MAASKVYNLSKSSRANEPTLSQKDLFDNVFSSWDSVAAPTSTVELFKAYSPAAYLRASSDLHTLHTDSNASPAQTASGSSSPVETRPKSRVYVQKSLMELAEERKEAIKAKQQVFKGDNRRKMMAPIKSVASPLVAEESSSGDDEPLHNRYSRILSNKSGKPQSDQPIFGEDQVMKRELEKLEKILKFEAEEAAKEAAIQAAKEAKRKILEQKKALKAAKRMARKEKKHTARPGTSQSPMLDVHPSTKVDMITPSQNDSYERHATDQEAEIVQQADSPVSINRLEVEPPSLNLDLGLNTGDSWFKEMEGSDSSDSDSAGHYDPFAGIPDPTIPNSSKISMPRAKNKQTVTPAEIQIESSSLGLNFAASSSGQSSSSESNGSYIPPFQNDVNEETDSGDEKPLGLKTDHKEEGEDSPLGYLHPQAYIRQEQQFAIQTYQQQQMAFMSYMQQQAALRQQAYFDANPSMKRVDNWRNSVELPSEVRF